MKTLENKVIELKGQDRRFLTKLLDDHKIRLDERGYYHKIFKAKN